MLRMFSFRRRTPDNPNAAFAQVSDGFLKLATALIDTGKVMEALGAEMNAYIDREVAKLTNAQREEYFHLVSGGMGKLDALVVVAP